MAFARDSTLLGGSDYPSDSTLSVLLDRLGVPHDPELAVIDTGCVLGGAAERAAEGAQRITCHMRDAADAIDVELTRDSADGWPERLRVLSGGSLAQEVAVDQDVDTPDESNVYLFAVDLDADGVRELMLRKFLAMRGNTAYQVFRFDPATRKLTADSVMSAMASPRRLAGRPCVHEQWNAGGGTLSRFIECIIDGQWIAMWSGSIDFARDTVMSMVRVRIGDSLHVALAEHVPVASWCRHRVAERQNAMFCQ